MLNVEVSIIIINYNTRNITSNCLASIKEHSVNVNYEIILVDNASTDGSKEFFSNYQDIIYIYNDSNLGFGRANNIGINRASGKYIFLLNSDTYLTNNALSYFLEYEKRHNDSVVLGSWLLNIQLENNHSYCRFPSIKNELSSAIRVYTDRLPFNATKICWTESFTNTDIDVDYITGADLFIPKDVIEKVGMFDERFFMYYEESDLQKRMQMSGISRRIIIGPRIVHFEQGSQLEKASKSSSKLLNSTTSMFIYLRKHNNFIDLLFFKVIYFVLRLLPIVFSEYNRSTKIAYIKLLIRG